MSVFGTHNANRALEAGLRDKTVVFSVRLDPIMLAEIVLAMEGPESRRTFTRSQVIQDIVDFAHRVLRGNDLMDVRVPTLEDAYKVLEDRGLAPPQGTRAHKMFVRGMQAETLQAEGFVAPRAYQDNDMERLARQLANDHAKRNAVPPEERPMISQEELDRAAERIGAVAEARPGMPKDKVAGADPGEVKSVEE